MNRFGEVGIVKMRRYLVNCLVLDYFEILGFLFPKLDLLAL